MSAREGLRIDSSDLMNGFVKFDKNLKKEIGNYLNNSTDELVAYMKKNARWKNRTGNARAGLNGHVEKSNDMFEIVLEHSVYYGVFLEYAMEMRFAILVPTITLKTPEVINGLKGLLNRMGY